MKIHIHTNCRWLSVFRPFGGGLGLALNPHVWFRYEPTPGQLIHEQVHIIQQEEMGLAKFLVVYFLELLFLGKRPISEHRLEAPAYGAEWALDREQANAQ